MKASNNWRCQVHGNWLTGPQLGSPTGSIREAYAQVHLLAFSQRRQGWLQCHEHCHGVVLGRVRGSSHVRNEWLSGGGPVNRGPGGDIRVSEGSEAADVAGRSA